MMFIGKLIISGLLCCAALCCHASLIAQAQTTTLVRNSFTGGSLMASRQMRGRVRAPELTGGISWLNTDTPLSLAALRGKVVLLDFWTYGCINCIHIIPDLKKLEAKYANQLVVIGVHSAKFDNEKDTENIRRIILRYEIEHPVVNDAAFKIFKAYGARAWPTQMLIDPAGYLVGQVSGEGNYEGIDRAIAQTVEEFRKRGELNEQPLKLALERAKVGDLPLAFPGKVLADPRGDRLFIADSNHNRIVVTKLDGTLVETIGTGAPGAQNGAFASATFYRPQGLALDGDSLYIADTENHLIRRADLRARTVENAAGTGQQSAAYGKVEGPSASTALNSPWDLQFVGHTLYIAMAGPHQIWQLNLDTQIVGTFAGSGREARLDGAREEAGFAQPSGITSDGKNLYVADSESNIIRAIDLASGQVRTLVGGDLFDFGDTDGVGDDVRLQHPLGIVVAANNSLLIADTYNHKIKRLNPRARTVETYAGTGRPGQTDGSSPSFYEPGGLTIAGDKLFIADTNNHAVRVLDLKRKRASTLMIKNLRPPDVSFMSQSAGEEISPNRKEIAVAAQRLSAATTGSLLIDVTLPAGYHLNAAAPQRYKVTVEDGASKTLSVPDMRARVRKDLQLPLRLPIQTGEIGQAKLRVETTLYYCREDNTGTCRVKTLVWRIPVEVTADKTAQAELKARAEIKLEE